jgi:hypothetical protein
LRKAGRFDGYSLRSLAKPRRSDREPGNDMWHAETVARTDHLPDAGRATNRLH